MAFELARGPSLWWKGAYDRGVLRGWMYAMDAVMPIVMSTRDMQGDTSNMPMVLMDTYVDRTFSPSNTSANDPSMLSLPYTTPWVGFVHHTFDTTFSQDNCTNLVQNPLFLASLASCYGLITFSQRLANMLTTALVAQGYSDVLVQAVVHPTPTTDAVTPFQMSNLAGADVQRVVTIGYWLRDQTGIVDLPLPAPSDQGPASLGLTKAVLLPNSPDSVFGPKDDDNPGSGAGVGTVGPELQAAIDNGSVEAISTLSDADYDTLLSQSVVFLKLIDASAVNTVLECVARGTPLIVNRLPALEELLGGTYLGFYDTLEEAAQLLTQMYQGDSLVATLSAQMQAAPGAFFVTTKAYISALDAILNGVLVQIDPANY